RHTISTRDWSSDVCSSDLVSTSRPAPEEFASVYRRLLDGGATGVLSVHLSASLSGTYDSARSAASGFDGRVEVVDSRSTGMGLRSEERRVGQEGGGTWVG